MEANLSHVLAAIRDIRSCRPPNFPHIGLRRWFPREEDFPHKEVSWVEAAET
jgi:hypothetical protein